MALPIYRDITIYRGDTFVEKIYPKNSDGTAFILLDSDDEKYDAYFYITGSRDTGITLNSYYTFVDTGENSITYKLSPVDSTSFTSGTPYVYEIKIKNKKTGEVYTLVTGNIIMSASVRVEI